MSRNRTIYNAQSLFVGPAPASGFHFVNQDGAFNNDHTNTSTNFNLVKSIYGVQSISYGIQVPYTDILHLGKEATVARAIVSAPLVNIDFSYLQQGVLNELRCGFYSNFTQVYGNVSGSAFYSNNTGVNLISGFTVNTLIPGENEIHYPQNYRDKRNLFVAIAPEGEDINPTSFNNIHPRVNNLQVIGFGNCYITNYSTSASVGEFPVCSMSYVGENMSVYASGTGIPIPAVEHSDRSLVANKKFNIPADFQGNSTISVLRPGDITLDITSMPSRTSVLAIQGTGIAGGNYSTIDGLGFSYSDIKIQSYNLNLPIPRSDIASFGNKLPINRPVDFPVNVLLNLTTIVGDTQTGHFVDLINRNDDYNITIKLRNATNASLNPNQVAVQYDLIRAKAESVSYVDQIGGQKTANINFRSEIDPNLIGYKGFYMSGVLNAEPLSTLYANMLKEDGDFLLKEDGDNIIAAEIGILF